MVKAKKSLGQNFLTDRRIARGIVDAVSPLPSDVIIEIGPGTGALTRMLCERSGSVVAIEIDADLIERLRHSIKSDKLSIVPGDALKLDWEALIDEARAAQTGQPRVRIVANLPYYISTPIIERLLSLRMRIFDMTLMLQKEVADRIISKPGGKQYGYLSVKVQHCCIATKLFEVPPSAFTPAPKVRSAVIRLVVLERPAVEVADDAKFFALVKALFAQRRKTILNNLRAASAALGITGEAEAALQSAAVDPGRRAETLSLAEFAALYHALGR